MQEYNRAMRACFLQMTKAGTTAILERMKQLAAEGSATIGWPNFIKRFFDSCRSTTVQ